MFVKDGRFFLTKWHSWHAKLCLFIAFVNLPFSSVGRAECKDGSQQELWKSKKLEKKLEKLEKELENQKKKLENQKKKLENQKKKLENQKKKLENLKKLEKLKPYALLNIGGRASRSTTLRNSVHYEL